ncbi:MAG: AI-2E family transporter [Pseudomonadota bacterium]
MSLRDYFFFITLAILIGYIMVVGKLVIMPILVAIMLSYILMGAVNTMSGWPAFKSLPHWVLFAIALSIFALTILSVGLVAVANLRNIASSAAQYQDNVMTIVARGAEALDLGDVPTWATLRSLTLDRIDMGAASLGLLGSIASIGGYTVLIMTYAGFMIAERGNFDHKLTLIFGKPEDRAAAFDVVSRINAQIVTYLFTKTLINIALGLISYVLMLVLGIENAVFWAFLIAIFNYIPYVGSLVGVGVVVVYSIAQFGALRPAAATLVLLTAAQVYVGNWLEPRMMSRSMNLSPFVVLAALVVWSSLWGVAGAIIAVPMTSILVIIFGAFERTRAIPILLSRDGHFEVAGVGKVRSS